MSRTPSRYRPRRAPGAIAVAAGLLVATASGVAAASGPETPAGSGEQAAARAGSCASRYTNPRYRRKYGARQGTIARGGTMSEPEFSLDGRTNRRLAFVSDGTGIAGAARPGVRNVYVTTRRGRAGNYGARWLKGRTVLVSAGVGGPADGDSFAPSLSGYTAKGDRAAAPRRIAFLSRATNLPGGNPTGTSAYVADAGGGGIRRLDVPGVATGVGISGDSKIVYVTTDSGIYLVRGSGKGRLLSAGPGMNTPTTTLNGKQAAYGQNGAIYTITSSGRRRKVAVGTDPQADGGYPYGGKRQGYVRAVSYARGGSAYKVGLIAKGSARGVRRLGRTASPTSINGGGSAVAFGNGSYACLVVQVLESGKRGGYAIPQGQCPNGGRVTDVGVSTRYNYLAFTCSTGGLHLFYVGGK
jgi:hypothetical protein